MWFLTALLMVSAAHFCSALSEDCEYGMGYCNSYYTGEVNIKGEYFPGICGLKKEYEECLFHRCVESEVREVLQRNLNEDFVASRGNENCDNNLMANEVSHEYRGYEEAGETRTTASAAVVIIISALTLALTATF